MGSDHRDTARRQRALADFGDLALRGEDLQVILDEGCQIVTGALGTNLGKILEVDLVGNTALVRAGVGWEPGIVGEMSIPLSKESSVGYAINEHKPVLTSDISAETRFDIPLFMREHGVVGLVNVPIFLPGGSPYGLLEVDSREPRDFSEEDIEFLRTYAAILGPVIDRLLKAAALQRSDERFRLVVDNARDFAILISDPDDIITDWFPGAVETFGWSASEVIGRPVSTIFTAEDRDNRAPEWETGTAAEQGKAPDVRWHVTKNGERVYLDGQTIALRSSDGKLSGFLKIAQNLTERKRNEERQSVLLAELQHRVRNVLAMIAAVVRRGDLNATTQQFRDALSGRIAAMARTQALLTRGAGAGVDLENMVRDEMLSQMSAEHRFSIAGPAIALAPKAAEVLTLAVHELATNAGKYGAFSESAGTIAVAWSIAAGLDSDWLEFSWVESGVELALELPRRTGFGTELVTRRVPYELRGKGELRLERSGLQCYIKFPLVPGESILQQTGPSGSAFRER
jgi:PAS domain S-box-containing protein